MSPMKTNEIVAVARKPKASTFTYSLKASSGYSAKITGQIRSPEHGIVIEAALLGMIPGKPMVIAAAKQLEEALREMVRVYATGNWDTEFKPALEKAEALLARIDQAPERAGGGE